MSTHEPQRRSIVVKKSLINQFKKLNVEAVTTEALQPRKRKKNAKLLANKHDIISTLHQKKEDYMKIANPPGKTRIVGAPKRNRKEQLPVSEQIRAGNELAKAYGGEIVLNSSTADDIEEKSKIVSSATNEKQTPPPASICISSSSSSSSNSSNLISDNNNNISGHCAAGDCSSEVDAKNIVFDRWKNFPRPSFMRNIRIEKQRKNLSPFCETILPLKTISDDVEQQQQQNQQHNVDNGDATKSSSIVVRKTDSTHLEPYDYRPYDRKHEFPDANLPMLREMQTEVYENAHLDYARHLSETNNTASGVGSPDKPVNDSKSFAEMAHQHFDQCGYGRAVVTMEDFDITRWQNCEEKQEMQCDENVQRPLLERQEQARCKSRCATNACRYPHSTNLRCRYDHHQFTGVPILLPLAYRPEPYNLLEVLPNMAFCSFACAIAYVDREAPRLQHSVRNDRRTLLKFMARRFFGISGPLRPAPMLELHCDYGGRLTTSQFRSLSDTHHSFVEYPLAVAVPARYVTQISITRRVDRAKRQGLHLRVSEQHGDALAPQPEDLIIDKNAPAAPRGAEARAARARLAAANAAAAAALGVDNNQTKKRVIVGENGDEINVDRSHIETVIAKTLKQANAAPKKKHMLETMMNIQEIQLENFTIASEAEQLNQTGTTQHEDQISLQKKNENAKNSSSSSSRLHDEDDANLFADIERTTMAYLLEDAERKKQQAQANKRPAMEAAQNVTKKRKTSEKMAALNTADSSNSSIVQTEAGVVQQPVKRKVGRPRKYPLPTPVE